MTSTSDADVTVDGFLGGRLHIRQPRRGYRAGVDPVLLAACVPATSGERALELGCGVGVASLCLAARTGAAVTGLELQPGYAALARVNADAHALTFDVVEGDLRDMPAVLRGESFDHVIANPPYFDRARGTAATDAGKEAAFGEAARLVDWVEAAVRRLRPKGWLVMIHRAERLQELLRACDARLGDLAVLPVVGRRGRAADRVILRARKGARGPLRLLPPLILHVGDRHLGDADSYAPHVQAVLRQGAALTGAFDLATTN